MNQSELVTKSLLKAFGDKSKQIFKRQPYIFEGESGNALVIKTDLTYGASGCDILQVELSGITGDPSSDEYAVKSGVYFNAKESAALDYCYTANSGSDRIKCVVLARSEEDPQGCCNIIILLEHYIKYLAIDLLASKEGVIYSNDHILDVVSTTVSSLQEDEPNTYIEVYNDSADAIYDTESSGEIVTTATYEPSFTIVESNSSEKSYPQEDRFDTIQHSQDSKALDHDLLFEYDYNTTLPSGEETTVGRLGRKLTLPIPELISGGLTDNGLRSVNVRNGLVVGGSKNISIPQATELVIGGVKLGTDRTYPIGKKVWVQLDGDGNAFVDLSEEDRHRGKLYEDEFQGDNIGNFEGNIYQHIGETTEDFVNGYFYKCVKSGYSITRQDSNTPYTMDTIAGLKLEQFIIDKEWPLDPSLGFDIYVDPIYYNQLASESEEDPDTHETVYTKTFLDIDQFYIKNTGTDIGYQVTKEELYSGVGISIRPEYQTELLHNYTVSSLNFSFEVSTSSWRWRQWDVQPRGGAGGCGCARIEEPEIDALFQTYVDNITVDETSISGEVNDTVVVTATLTPSGADDTTVTWVSADPNVAFVPAQGNPVTVVLTGEGETSIRVSAVNHPLEEPVYTEISVIVSNALNTLI